MTGTLHEDHYTFVVISRSVRPRMRNVSDKSCRENQETTFIFSNFFRKLCLLWDNVEKYSRAGKATGDNMRVSRRVPKAANTHLEYVIVIAFLLQQWLHESTTVLRYTYTGCFVTYF